MQKIFVSYRRVDSEERAHRIADRLISKHGKNNVFIDVDAILGGEDFANKIEQCINEADIVLVIIGEKWVDEFARRKSLPDKDFVRFEVSKSLKDNKNIIPILTRRGIEPDARLLPEDVRPITRLNYMYARGGSDFNRDIDQLWRRIVQIFTPPKPPPSLPTPRPKTFVSQKPSTPVTPDILNRNADRAHMNCQWQNEIDYLNQLPKTLHSKKSVQHRLKIAKQNLEHEDLYHKAANHVRKKNDLTEDDRKIARSYLEELRKSAPYYGDPQNIFLLARMPMPPAENFIQYSDRLLRPQELENLEDQAEEYHQIGEWNREIQSWREVIDLLTLQIVYVSKFGTNNKTKNKEKQNLKNRLAKANHRFSIASNNQSAKKLYDDAQQNVSAKRYDIAKTIIEKLRKEAPYHGDPEKICVELGVKPLRNYHQYEEKLKREHHYMCLANYFPFIISLSLLMSLAYQSLIFSTILGLIISVLTFIILYLERNEIGWNIIRVLSLTSLFIPIIILIITNFNQNGDGFSYLEIINGTNNSYETTYLDILSDAIKNTLQGSIICALSFGVPVFFFMGADSDRQTIYFISVSNLLFFIFVLWYFTNLPNGFVPQLGIADEELFYIGRLSILINVESIIASTLMVMLLLGIGKVNRPKVVKQEI